MGTSTDELNALKKSRKTVVSVVAAIVVASTPGVYGAYQSAKQEWKKKFTSEQSVRDKQEKDLQTYVKANKQEIDNLKSAFRSLSYELSMTRTQLVSVVVLLSQQTRRPASAVSDAVKKLTKPPPLPAPPKFSKPKRPSLKPAPMIRQMVLEQKKAS